MESRPTGVTLGYWIGVLELDFATDDLTLWRWVFWVEAVLLEALRANVRSWDRGIGLEPCTVDGSALEAASVVGISTQLTVHETTESCGLRLVEDQVGVQGLVLKLGGIGTERMVSVRLMKMNEMVYLVTGSLPSTGGALGM